MLAESQPKTNKKKKSFPFICIGYLPVGILHADHFSFTSPGPALITQTTYYLTVCKYIKASHCCAQVHLKLSNVERKGGYGRRENHISLKCFTEMSEISVLCDQC